MAEPDNTESPVGFDSLPDEMVLKIFSHLSQRELLEALSQVCCHWQELVADCTLWRSLHFTGGKKYRPGAVFLNEVVPILQKGLKLSHLKITHCSQKEMKELLTNCTENQVLLQSLYFKRCDVNIEALRSFAEKCPNVTYIKIDENVHLTDPDVFGAFKNLQRIVCDNPLNLEHLKNFALSCSNFSEVKVGFSLVTGEEYKKILVNHPKLEVLDIEQSRIAQNRIYDIFRGNKSITKLTVVNCYSDDGEHSIDYTPLLSLPNLKYLKTDIFHSKFSFASSFSAISKSITELDLCAVQHRMEPTDNDLVFLARKLPELQVLTIDCWKITDQGIYQFLKKARKLRELKVCTQCNDDATIIAGEEWIPYIHKHPSLKQLDIEECRLITDESLAILISTCPHINIITAYTDNSSNENEHHSLSNEEIENVDIDISHIFME